MAEVKEPFSRFLNYPRAVEGPHVLYKKKKDENPPLSGIPLLIAAWMSVSRMCCDSRLTFNSVTSFQFVRNYLWRNAGGDSLRNVKHLDAYKERWDVSYACLVKSPV